jgi:hypothetical protein
MDVQNPNQNLSFFLMLVYAGLYEWFIVISAMSAACGG